MAEHTPGPWEYDEEFNAIVRRTDRTTEVIADMPDASADDGSRVIDLQAQADAQLIAAAPELLAMLDRLLDDGCHEYHPTTGMPSCFYCAASLFDGGQHDPDCSFVAAKKLMASLSLSPSSAEPVPPPSH